MPAPGSGSCRNAIHVAAAPTRPIAGTRFCYDRPLMSTPPPDRASASAVVPLFEFHVARAARERYALDPTWFGLSGNVVIADLGATRRLALRMNQVRDAGRHPERTVQAGELHAMGLIDEVLHFVAGLYRAERRDDIQARALEFLRA